MGNVLKTTMKGNRVTLAGTVPAVGDPAPQFTALDTDLSPVSLSDFQGKYVLISAVPSLDTGTCDAQTRRFNSEAAQFTEDTVILTISMDLPFAQKRWCGAAGIDRVITLSDHRDADFGTSYGVLIQELRLLNRSIFVLDKDHTVVYHEVVQENTEHPNYDAALKALRELTK